MSLEYVRLRASCKIHFMAHVADTALFDCPCMQQPVLIAATAAHVSATSITVCHACNPLKLLFMCRRLIPVSDSYEGDSFFTVENGKKIATPLLLVLAVVELSDVVFAVDSIPAVSAARLALLLHVLS